MKHRIYLRALELEDYKTSIKWRNDPEILNMVGGIKYFVSEERERQWVEHTINSNKDKIVCAICLCKNDKYIGNVILQEINLINRSAEDAVMIGDKSEWNKGYATEAIMLILKFAFEERGIERVWAEILKDNINSRKMHEKCGYKLEGIKRKAVFKSGKFHDVLLMSILKEEFEIAYKNYITKFQ